MSYQKYIRAYTNEIYIFIYLAYIRWPSSNTEPHVEPSCSTAILPSQLLGFVGWTWHPLFGDDQWTKHFDHLWSNSVMVWFSHGDSWVGFHCFDWPLFSMKQRLSNWLTPFFDGFHTCGFQSAKVCHMICDVVIHMHWNARASSTNPMQSWAWNWIQLT